MAWSRGLPIGSHEATPIVHQGVMYTVIPGGGVIARQRHQRRPDLGIRAPYPKEMADFVGGPERARSKGLAIYEDMIYFLAHDGAIVALDAKTGKERWATSSRISRSSHRPPRHRWWSTARSSPTAPARRAPTASFRRMTRKPEKNSGSSITRPRKASPAATPGARLPTEKRIASAWGLPGSYDPERKLLYWGISNPKPWTRLEAPRRYRRRAARGALRALQ